MKGSPIIWNLGSVHKIGPGGKKRQHMMISDKSDWDGGYSMVGKLRFPWFYVDCRLTWDGFHSSSSSTGVEDHVNAEVAAAAPGNSFHPAVS